jgi:hypothetical protein
MSTPTHLTANGAPPRIQRFSGQPTRDVDPAPASVEVALASPGTPLEPSLRQDMEKRVGCDFSKVLVHTDATATQSARDVKAHAYTVGRDIVFAEQMYAPATLAGKRLLAHELVHTVQQTAASSMASSCKTRTRSDSVASKTTFLVQRRETGSGLEDPLYMTDRRWSLWQGPDDRVTGQRLQNWAIARGSFVVRSEEALKRMQEKDGAESEIVADILVLLVDLLEGRDPTSPYDTSAVFWGTGPHFRIEGERTRLDKFEGSENAREMAVMELEDHWGPIEYYLTRALTIHYRDSYLEAAGRTPKDMSLEDDTEVIKQVRYNPYGHVYSFPQGMAGDVTVRVGQRYGRLNIKDIRLTGGSGSGGPGTIWAWVEGYPLWYYSGSIDVINRQAVFGEVARSVAESAHFAGMLLPLMIKTAGLALSFSPAPLIMIAGVVVEELGEEGLRDLTGESRSFKDIASGAAREILVNLVLGKLLGGGGEGKGASEAAEALDKVAEKAAIRVRASVEKEIVRTEGPKVAHAMEAGETRTVVDQELTDEGFSHEVNIRNEGAEHTYRRRENGEWCRWSKRRLCGFDAREIEAEYQHVIHERERMIAPSKQVLDETGLKEITGVPGPVPVESGVKGTMGEAGHAAEVAKRLPTKSKDLLSAAEILKEREALLRGDITLRELVEKYPEEGAAQVFFPTARGGGRFVDHVYLEENTMFVVFRESKNYSRFRFGFREVTQLEKDLAFLTRFKGVRVEWRISGAIEQETLAALNKTQKDTNGLFRYVVDPGRP